MNESTRRQILTPALHEAANAAVPDTVDLRAAIHARIQTRPAAPARPPRRGLTGQQVLIPALSLALMVPAGLAIYAAGRPAEEQDRHRQVLAQAATATAHAGNSARTIKSSVTAGSPASILATSDWLEPIRCASSVCNRWRFARALLSASASDSFSSTSKASSSESFRKALASPTFQPAALSFLSLLLFIS